MNEKVLTTLEFVKIREMLDHFAGSSMGKAKVKALVPTDNLRDADAWQQETADAYSRLCRRGNLSFSGVPDIRDSFLRLERGGCLTMVELLRVSSLLTATNRVKSYGYSNDREQEEEVEQDSLAERFTLLEPIASVNRELTRCILSEEEMADDASAGLKSVRREIKRTNDKIHERMASILSHASANGMLQDNLITMRDGRYCLPYKSEYKNQVGGMVHDQSSSGSTSFIEPPEVVKLNNDLRELAIKEKEEIEKVLEQLTGLLRPELPNLRYNLQALGELDFIFAKACLAREMRATRPEFSSDRSLVIKQGRHPLIPDKKVVPIDLSLGHDHGMMIITGPNTGGKTVTLKTTGLFTLMGQAGLHIPAAQGSTLGIFKEVFADIGDEQSIEQSLSTFSSHMTHTVKILEQADENSLVLFDELGAGTDPTEGAALAMAILTELHNRGARVMTTSHYAELKVFAMTTPGVVNACCEFNVETLSPTYRLLVGIPGKSNAFAISKKLGLSDMVIQMADSFIGVKDRNFEDMMADLEVKRQLMEQELADARAEHRKASEERTEWQKKNKNFDDRKEQEMQKMRAEARAILEDAKETADETIRRMRQIAESSGNAAKLEDNRRKLREKLDGMQEKQKIVPKKQVRALSAKDLHIGDSVMVLSMNLKGTIHTLPNAKGDCQVTMGIMTAKVNLKDLELLPDEEDMTAKKKGGGVSTMGLNKAAYVSPEINLVGKRVDEALAELDKYLDDAYLAHLAKVTVIHGRGTGALRQAVQNHCKRLSYVKSCKTGEYGEGDHGVTIVEFK